MDMALFDNGRWRPLSALTDGGPSGELSPPKLVHSATPEERLWLCVVLRGIADQDERFVVGEPDRVPVVADAREWIDSPEFAWVCEQAGLSRELAGSITPEQAHAALRRLST